MRSSQAANDSQSKASSQTDDGGDLHDLYNAEMAAHGLKMVDFLSATSLHSEDSDAERDTTGWELRYSTPDVLPRSAKQPASTGARSVDSDTQEDTTQRAEEDQGQTVEFEEEEEVQKDTHTDAYRPCEEEREVSLSLFPEDPPSTTRREQAGKHMLDSTRMSSYSSTRLVSIGNCELSRSVANEAAAGRYASRKRQRTVKEEGPVAPDASSRTGERATEEWAEAPETTCVRNSTAQVFFSEVENCSFGQSQGEKLPCTGMLPANRAQPPAAAAGAAAAAAAEVKAAAEHKTPWARVKEPLQVEARNSSEDTATVEADAWHEGSTVPAHDAENEADDQESSRGVCEGDFSGPLHHYSVSLSPCRSSDPATSRSTEVFETISRAISGCAYGPRLHLLILSCMFLAAWALLTLIYLLEGGRGSRFFVGLAVALSFVLSLCTGAVQLTASLVKWKALKCSLDMDLRERIFASLKRLQLEEEAGDQSSEGKKECGKLLHLLCSSFAGAPEDGLHAKSAKTEVDGYS
ncbi:uncharacterized protein EMH_0051040 [Eimeria mitis]|uniref:Transmembrane protein n=1 Tax=Eimeria mitis TaxID=44415 RepID=U6JZV7_9EIME|nr:uncharacterized protein EMH_0051040 [Eimeria mitis]CDJ29597.1 hypothetical protein, conserved [Eimeria mitis]